MKHLLPILFFISVSSQVRGQIYNVFEIQGDSLHFDGRSVILPPGDFSSKSYMLQLDSIYTITGIELDIVTKGVSIYAWDPDYSETDGDLSHFHLIVATNDTDQKYRTWVRTQYILIRTPKVRYQIGVDFEFVK